MPLNKTRLVDMMGKRLPYVILLFASLPTIFWLPPDRVYLSGDFFIPLSGSPENHLSLWSGDGLGYRQSNIPLFTLWQGFFDVLKYTGFDIHHIESIYFFLGFYFASSSFYFFYSNLTNGSSSKIAGIIASISYIYSPVILLSVIFIPLFAAIPLLSALLIKSLRSNAIVYSVIAGVLTPILFINFPNPLHPILLLFVLVPIALYLFLVAGKKMSFIIRLGRSVLVFSVIALTVNLWWILPSIGQISAAASALQSVSVQEFGKGHNYVADSFRLLNSWTIGSGWADKSYVPFAKDYTDNYLLVFFSYVPTFLGFSFLIYRRNSGITFVFAFLTLVFLYLSSGSNFIGNPLYERMVESFSIFKVFRDPFKFQYVTTLALSFLIGISITKHLNTLTRLRLRLGANSLIGGVLAIILITGWPLITGDVLRNWYAPTKIGVQVPDYYYSTNALLSKDTDSFRILFLPFRADPYMAYTWGYQGAEILSSIFSKDVISGNTGVYLTSNNADLIDRIFDQRIDSNERAKIISLLNIKYVVVDYTVDTEFYNMKSPALIDKALSSDHNFVEFAKVGNLVIYKVVPYSARIHSTESSELEATRLKPTLYEVKVGRNPVSNIFLSESYDSKWILKTGGQIIHSVPYEGFNIFKLEKPISGQTIIIEYADQLTFEIGVMLTSAFVIMTVFFVLCYFFWKKPLVAVRTFSCSLWGKICHALA